MRPALGQDAADGVEHDGDCGLVVAAEDRGVPVAHDSVLDDRVDGIDRGDGVEVRAEEERLAFGRWLERDHDVPHRRADRRARVVLVGREAEVADIAEHEIGDCPLRARWARHGCELEEEIEGFGGHGAPMVEGGRDATV